jgi:hypothetical protein
MPFMHLTHKQKNALELEVVPQEARLELTRMIRHACHGGDETEITFIRENEFIKVGIRLTHQATISSMRGWKTILGT